MTVTLLLQDPAPAPGMPEYIKSTFNTQEEAFAQAVHDLTPGEGGSGRVDKAGYAPIRIEDEDGNQLVDKAELIAAAEAAVEAAKAAASA